VEGWKFDIAPGMECRREPWCVTKIVKTTLQVLKPSKLSEVTLKTLLVNFARLLVRRAGGRSRSAFHIGPRGGNSEKKNLRCNVFNFYLFFAGCWWPFLLVAGVSLW
jgi:hypothetical protein